MTTGSRPEQVAASQAIEIMQALSVVPAPSFKVKVEVKGGEKTWVLLRFKGPINNRDSCVLGRVLDSLNRKPVGIVVLDFTRVTHIDDACLGELLIFSRDRESMPDALTCPLVLSGSAVFEKIETLGLSGLFEIFESLQEAKYSLGLTAQCEFARKRAKGKLNISAKVKLIMSTPRTAIVTLKGYLQAREAEYLSWLLRQAGRRGARHIIINLSGVSYANSPAIGVLLASTRVWHEAYGESCVGLAGVNTSLVCTLRLLGVDQYFVIANTVQEVRDAFESKHRKETAPAAGTPSTPKIRAM